MSQVEIDDAEWANPDNWGLDSLYFSRRDSRPFVPTRGCDELLGATVNFARPAGILMLCGFLGFPIVIWWLRH
jgi:uncharacterized membrane protein